MDLQAWNDALLDDVRGRAGQRLYLYVDRDLLGKLTGLEPAEAVADFCEAVRAVSGRRPFQGAALAAVRWKLDGYPGKPAFVAHLAMTVLAVTEEPLGASHGIYRQQNKLLGLPATTECPPGYEQDVPLLWRVWNSWLEGPGSVYGRPSARSHPHWTRQGWARSQALIRHSDRLRIEHFLEDVDPGRRRHPSVRELRTWLRYRGTYGYDLLARTIGEAAGQILHDVLEEEIERWHRVGPRTAVPHRRRGLLHYDDWTGSFRGAVAVEPDWHGSALDIGEDETHTADAFEPLLLITPRVQDEQLLDEGVDHVLTDTVRLRFGGEDLYVMRDEPRLSGRLQCRAADSASVVHILVHHSRVEHLSRALRHAGCEPRQKVSPVDGWLWLEDVRIDPAQAELMHLLRLLVPTFTERRLALQGGLRISGNTYLTGFEPDVSLGASTDVRLDGTLLPSESGKPLSLAGECIDPGYHRLSIGHEEIAFRSVAFVRETAQSGSVALPIERGGGWYLFREPMRDPEEAAALSGGALVGVTMPDTLVVRRPANADCLVITQDGTVLQVWPSTPRWLHEVNVEPAAVDVLDAVRTTPSPAVCFVVRQSASGSKRAIAVPTGTTQMPGRVPSTPRPDLVADLVVNSDWRWVGPKDQRVQQALAQAIRRPNHRANKRRQGRQDSAPASKPPVKPGVLDGFVTDNPFDDILLWLSEREHARASYADFAGAWAWLCLRYRYVQMADQWRLALTTLSRLGHVERDFDRQQVAAAPAALVALPSAAGLHLLCGARPARLLERMNDPDDTDPAVAAAAVSSVLHIRTPLDSAARPNGPGVVYLEIDSERRGEVEEGLRPLGVRMYGQVGVRLLAMQPSIDQVVKAGQRLDMSPGREPRQRAFIPPGPWQWARRLSDGAPGLYCYAVRGRNITAWRPAPGEALVRVPPEVGEWLCRQSREQRSLLVHDPLGRRLYAPRSVPLPPLIARALTLRSGLPPYPVKAHRIPLGAEAKYLVYQNVDGASAERVAHLLHQDLVIINDSTRMFE